LLAGRPVLLLDEPFAALDSITRASMQEWLAAPPAAEPRAGGLVAPHTQKGLLPAGRAAVMSPPPPPVGEGLRVPFPRPRRRRETVTDAAFAELRQRALEALER